MKKLKEVYFRFREPINYVLFGAGTTLVDWSSYSVLEKLGMAVQPANVVSLVLAILFAYVTNKRWVFFSEEKGFRAILREAAEFFAGRIVTALLELFGVPLLMAMDMDWTLHFMELEIEGFWAKILASVVVIVLNYFFSKFVVFRKKKTVSENAETEE